MKFKELDTVVLDRDVLESGLRKGDLGTVVQAYEPDGLEVEFVTAPGRTLHGTIVGRTDEIDNVPMDCGIGRRRHRGKICGWRNATPRPRRNTFARRRRSDQ